MSILAFVVVVLGLGTAEAADWFPSKYGAEDRLGAINNLSAQAVVEAAGLITTGKVYSLAMPTGPKTPAFGPRNYQIRTDRIFVGDSPTVGANKLQGFDDLVISWLGVGTQIDGFAHVGSDGRHYNGVPTEEVIRPDGAIQYGIHTLPPIVGRGVLLDMAAAAGVAQLPERTVFESAELRTAAQRQGLEIRTGDVVLLHTGWLSVADEDGERFLAKPPGIGLDGAAWLADQDVVAVGADTWTIEGWPTNDKLPDHFLPVHDLLLTKRGVYILENIKTAELAADRAYEFFFMLAAPRLVGAVQSPVHPVAIR